MRGTGSRRRAPSPSPATASARSRLGARTGTSSSTAEERGATAPSRSRSRPTTRAPTPPAVAPAPARRPDDLHSPNARARPGSFSVHRTGSVADFPEAQAVGGRELAGLGAVGGAQDREEVAGAAAAGA